jgi:hypothetical protein
MDFGTKYSVAFKIFKEGEKPTVLLVDFRVKTKGIFVLSSYITASVALESKKGKP